MKTLLSSKLLVALPIVFIMGCEGKPNGHSTTGTTAGTAQVEKRNIKNFKLDGFILETSYPEVFNELVKKVNTQLNYKSASETSTANTKKFAVGVYNPVIEFCIKDSQVIGEWVENKGNSYYTLINTPELDKCITQRLAMPIEFDHLSAFKGSTQYRMFSKEPNIRAQIDSLKKKNQFTNADLLRLYHDLAILYAKNEQEAIQIVLDDL